MCEFCKNSNIVCDDYIAYGYSFHQRKTILSNGRVMTIEFKNIDLLNNNLQGIDFKINYCPICGRDLRSEENE